MDQVIEGKVAATKDKPVVIPKGMPPIPFAGKKSQGVTTMPKFPPIPSQAQLANGMRTAAAADAANAPATGKVHGLEKATVQENGGNQSMHIVEEQKQQKASMEPLGSNDAHQIDVGKSREDAQARRQETEKKPDGSSTRDAEAAIASTTTMTKTL